MSRAGPVFEEGLLRVAVVATRAALEGRLPYNASHVFEGQRAGQVGGGPGPQSVVVRDQVLAEVVRPHAALADLAEQRAPTSGGSGGSGTANLVHTIHILWEWHQIRVLRKIHKTTHQSQGCQASQDKTIHNIFGTAKEYDKRWTNR